MRRLCRLLHSTGATHTTTITTAHAAAVSAVNTTTITTAHAAAVTSSTLLKLVRAQYQHLAGQVHLRQVRRLRPVRRLVPASFAFPTSFAAGALLTTSSTIAPRPSASEAAPFATGTARVALTLFRPLAPDEPTIGQAALADTLTHAGASIAELHVLA